MLGQHRFPQRGEATLGEAMQAIPPHRIELEMMDDNDNGMIDMKRHLMRCRLLLWCFEAGLDRCNGHCIVGMAILRFLARDLFVLLPTFVSLRTDI